MLICVNKYQISSPILLYIIPSYESFKRAVFLYIFVNAVYKVLKLKNKILFKLF